MTCDCYVTNNCNKQTEQTQPIAQLDFGLPLLTTLSVLHSLTDATGTLASNLEGPIEITNLNYQLKITELLLLNFY